MKGKSEEREEAKVSGIGEVVRRGIGSGMLAKDGVNGRGCREEAEEVKGRKEELKAYEG